MSHPSHQQRWSVLERWLACIALAGVAAFILLVLALHALEPGFTPLQHAVSEYANGRFGALLAAAFILRGVAVLALAVGLALDLSHSGWSWLGVVTLALYGLSSIVAALFPTDVAGTTPTLTGTIHLRAGTFAFVSVAIAALALSLAFAHDVRWHAFRPATWVFTALLLVELVVVVGVFVTPHAGIFGAVERLFAATVAVWLIAVATYMYRMAARGTTAITRPTPPPARLASPPA